ncbi:hypothetical protein MW290_25665 [Aquincola tertiaricarbonis]|uniref:Uncharacterized protein n=1 Tax=Aquincola tertiaricarbonis TaxID=391953 RepID=A0ABY4SCC3_AQUTE|nr:hypothetical protein [Aquincola tertiaricarbonis]URI08960.1 hypothetical protein MW290_25665 [Aquincola tertiaricarbonis]
MSCANPCTTMCAGCETRVTQAPRDPLDKSHVRRIARAVPVAVLQALDHLRAAVSPAEAKSLLTIREHILGTDATHTQLHAVLNADASEGYITDSEDDAVWVATGYEAWAPYIPPAMGDYFRAVHEEDGPLQQVVLVLPRLATPEADR